MPWTRIARHESKVKVRPAFWWPSLPAAPRHPLETPRRWSGRAAACHLSCSANWITPSTMHPKNFGMGSLRGTYDTPCLEIYSQEPASAKGHTAVGTALLHASTRGLESCLPGFCRATQCYNMLGGLGTTFVISIHCSIRAVAAAGLTMLHAETRSRSGMPASASAREAAAIRAGISEPSLSITKQLMATSLFGKAVSSTAASRAVRSTLASSEALESLESLA